MTKSEIRKLMMEKRKLACAKDLEAMNKKISSRLFELEEYQKCSALFSYISLQSEASTYKIILKAFLDKKKVFVPRVEGHNMNFYEITSLTSLNTGIFGILEPDESYQKPYSSSFESFKSKLMLLPGLGFDISGNRIGYGAGYYDRYLSEHSRDDFIKIALAYDFQLMDRINVMNYDIQVDFIVTSDRTINCKM